MCLISKHRSNCDNRNWCCGLFHNPSLIVNRRRTEDQKSGNHFMYISFSFSDWLVEMGLAWLRPMCPISLCLRSHPERFISIYWSSIDQQLRNCITRIKDAKITNEDSITISPDRPTSGTSARTIDQQSYCIVFYNIFERFKHAHLHDTHAIDLPSSGGVLDFKASVELWQSKLVLWFISQPQSDCESMKNWRSKQQKSFSVSTQCLSWE